MAQGADSVVPALLVVVCLTLAATAPAVARQIRAVDDRSPISIGIMRVDGVLIPLVTLDRDSRQPLMVMDSDQGNRFAMSPEAASLESGRWTLWRRAGDGPVEFRITGRAIVDFGYSFHEVWNTTFKGTPARRGYVPVRTIGLATQGAIVEQPETLVSQPDAASQRVGLLISRLAQSKESELLGAEPNHPLQLYSAAVRAKTIVRLKKLWRRRTPDADTYYFEAVKQYGYLPMMTSGWIVVSSGRTTTRDVVIAAADDIYKQGVFRNVLGIVPFRATTSG